MKARAIIVVVLLVVLGGLFLTEAESHVRYPETRVGVRSQNFTPDFEKAGSQNPEYISLEQFLTDSFTASTLVIQKEFDSTHLAYFGARYYDPTSGRFTSVDPYMGDLAVPQSLLKYSYAYNNPFRFYDPTGLMTQVQAGVGKYDVLSPCNMESGIYWIDASLLNSLNTFSNAVYFTVNAGTNAFCVMGEKQRAIEEWVLIDLAGGNEIDVEAFETMFMLNAPARIGASLPHAKAGFQMLRMTALNKLDKLSQKYQQAVDFIKRVRIDAPSPLQLNSGVPLPGFRILTEAQHLDAQIQNALKKWSGLERALLAKGLPHNVVLDIVRGNAAHDVGLPKLKRMIEARYPQLDVKLNNSIKDINDPLFRSIKRASGGEITDTYDLTRPDFQITLKGKGTLPGQKVMIGEMKPDTTSGRSAADNALIHYTPNAMRGFNTSEVEKFRVLYQPTDMQVNESDLVAIIEQIGGHFGL